MMWYKIKKALLYQRSTGLFSIIAVRLKWFLWPLVSSIIIITKVASIEHIGTQAASSVVAAVETAPSATASKKSADIEQTESLNSLQESTKTTKNAENIENTDARKIIATPQTSNSLLRQENNLIKDQAAQSNRDNSGAIEETVLGMNVTGNRELPNLLYIIPWKNVQKSASPPALNRLVDEVYETLDPEEFARRSRFYATFPPLDGTKNIESH